MASVFAAVPTAKNGDDFPTPGVVADPATRQRAAMAMTSLLPIHWLLRSIYASAVGQGLLTRDWSGFVGDLRVAEFVEKAQPIPAGAYEFAWEYLSELSTLEPLALSLGERQAAHLGVVDVLLRCSDTVEDALDALCRYWPIVSSESEWALTKAGFDTTLSVHPVTDAYACRGNAEYVASSILSVLRKLTARPLSPKSVQFQHGQPHQYSEYFRIFRAPLRFGGDAIRLTFHAKDLQQPCLAADSALLQRLRALADGMLPDRQPEKDVVALVRGVLLREMGRRTLGIADVGRVLAMSTRTLQRRLAEAGTTFDQVLMDYRKEMAVGLLRAEGSRVDDISSRLGYANPSNFIRAFKVWFAATPAEFRSRESPRPGQAALRQSDMHREL